MKTLSTSEIYAKNPFSYDALEGDSLLLGWRRGGADSSNMGFAIDTVEAEGVEPCPVELGREGHVVTIAPTGSGKGRGCIIPTLLTYNGPTIVIDPKGENAAVTAQRRRDMGHEVHVVDPFGVSGQQASRFNPMDLIEPQYADAVDDAVMIASMIMPACDKDPFWPNRAVQLILGLMMYVCYDEPRSQRNLSRVRELLTLVSTDRGAARAKFAVARHAEARNVSAMLADCASNTMYGITSFASDAVDLFRGESLTYNMYASSFDLADVTRGKPMTIYLVLPPHLLKSHAPVLRLWMGVLFAALTRRRSRPELPTLLLIDEAAQLGTFDPLMTSVTLLRGYGVRTWSFWQDASQIQRLYTDWPSLINNCHAVQIFGKLGALAASSASELLGLESPNMLRGLKEDEVVMALAGEDPRVLRRPDYLRDDDLTALAEPNPYYGDGARPIPRRRAPEFDGAGTAQRRFGKEPLLFALED